MISQKKCSKCDTIKDLDLFNRDKSSKDGRRTNCKECSKLYRENNRENAKEYRKTIKEKRSEIFKSWYLENKNIKKQINKDYYDNNKLKVKEKASEYYENNKDRKLEYQKKYQSENKDKRNKQLSERRQNDSTFRLVTNIRNLINNSFYKSGYSKKSKTQEILGCSYDEFKIYLESKFENWMTWENRGIYTGELNMGWDIDHVIPLSNAQSEEEIIKINHYTNLQPLCTKINRDIKKDKIEYEFI
jgi:hypothetical protein